jgi:tRNA-splicing ligase RtcB
MKWVYTENVHKPIKSWCKNIETDAMKQAINLANHPATYKHIALMPDCHVGYGMPIGGVIACDNAVIPNAVGVDIGCGMGAVETDFNAEKIEGMKQIRSLMDYIKNRVPVGEGRSHKTQQSWDGFGEFLDTLKSDPPAWYSDSYWARDAKNLGTLGGGNHFIELQVSDTGKVWLMLHSGSRNLGHRIASHYQKLAVDLNQKWKIVLPDTNLAYLPADSEGRDYIRDMNFALKYAAESRSRMMEVFKEGVVEIFGDLNFIQDINIHHNYANLENHSGKNLWIHRKGATSAQKEQPGIIPGSMGTASYIVKGLGNSESFMSCSHGAGRVMGRSQASRQLTVEECDKAMEGVVFDRWHSAKQWSGGRKKKYLDLSEAPQAYKDIDQVIESEADLVKPLVRLKPLGVVKG